jgi:hypothetical protein
MTMKVQHEKLLRSFQIPIEFAEGLEVLAEKWKCSVNYALTRIYLEIKHHAENGDLPDGSNLLVKGVFWPKKKRP